MYSNGIKATLKNVTFSHNVSGSFGGGGLISASGTLNLTNVTFSDNRANDDGGALLTQLSSITNLNDVTFTGNVADADDDGGGDGGGLYNAGGSINVQNTILARNSRPGRRGPRLRRESRGNRLRVRRSQPDRLNRRLPLPGTRQRHLPGRESAPRPPRAQWRLHPDRRPTQAQQGDQPRLGEAARDRRLGMREARSARRQAAARPAAATSARSSASTGGTTNVTRSRAPGHPTAVEDSCRP